MDTPVEVCFLIDDAGVIVWRDRSTSAAALPDSSERWRAVWRHREALNVIAHSHPRGPLAFSREDRTTMEAIDAGLGRPVRYAVVTADGLIYRDPDGTDRIATDHPAWVAILRDESGMPSRA
jgi:proteasome lid subunit RPN8/RPN11